MSVPEQESFFSLETAPLTAPVEFGGKIIKANIVHKTVPRKWTKAELVWCVEKKLEGFSLNEIANALGRSEVSVSVKLKRNTKSNDTYNKKFREMKYLANASFLKKINPTKVLDLYAGQSWWQERVESCTTNDKDKSFKTDFNLPAFDLLCDLYRQRKGYDVIDLDPFGSAYECFDFAIRMAKKGIVISFGEWGHRRWKRFDFVKHRYQINSKEDWGIPPFVREIERIAYLHKKKATVFESLQYSSFLRIYFVLTSFKETSQWSARPEMELF